MKQLLNCVVLWWKEARNFLIPIKKAWTGLKRQERVQRERKTEKQKARRSQTPSQKHTYKESCQHNKKGLSLCSVMEVNQVMINVLQLLLSFQWSLFSSVSFPTVHKHTKADTKCGSRTRFESRQMSQHALQPSEARTLLATHKSSRYSQISR